MAASAGLNYRWQIAGPRPLNILQTIGNGCAFLDYDNDGNLDVLLVGPKLALYKGDGKGHFTDVTHALGLDHFSGHFLGCAVGDYDNDGYDDVYVSGYRTGLLLHNEAGKGFRDVTAQAGLKPQPWGTSAAWAEAAPGSGRLDLFVANYARYDAHSQQLCPVGPASTPSSCPPSTYVGIPGVLYHNLGRGRFQNVTAAWGADTATGHGLAVAAATFDGSGRVGLAVANDEQKGDLFQSDRAGHFMNVGVRSGTGMNASGNAHGGMGMDWGDYDNDGKPDLFVATYVKEAKEVYHNLGDGVFKDISGNATFGFAAWRNVAWGSKWLDADNSGWLDLMVACGHVYSNAAVLSDQPPYREPTSLFYNLGGKAFVDATKAGMGALPPIVGRGLAVGDFDNDGKVDALVVDSEGAPLLLRNESRSTGHWLSFTLVGTGPRCNRDGYGAQVTVTAGSLTQTRVCHADGSYLSSSDKRVHVGLGAAVQAASVTVRWPDGRVDKYADVAGDRGYVAREGSKTLDAWPRHRP